MQQQWVDWGLLTNGVVLKLFKLRKSEDQPSVELLGESEISELRQHSWLVRTLSKESIRSGDAEGIYRSVERRRKAVSQLTRHKDEIADELLEVLSERVGDSIAREAESETKAFIDDLVESLSNGELSGVEGAPESVSTASNPDPEPVSAAPKSEGESVRESTEEYVVAFGEDGSEASHRATTQSDAMAKAVDHLVSEHDLIERLPSFPYTPGKKHTILSDRPEHADGETMALFRELNEGYYVFTGIGTESKKRYVRRFAEVCDVEGEFGGAW
jgi:predicted type IV restriction endonuclease